MRMSDWMSDVCSSDLPLDVRRRDVADAPPAEGKVALQEPLVSLHRARAVLLPALGEVQLLRVVEGVVERADLPERLLGEEAFRLRPGIREREQGVPAELLPTAAADEDEDRKSTRLNSSH